MVGEGHLMLKVLAVLLWPAGITVILAATALVGKRPVRRFPPATAPMNRRHGGDLLVGKTVPGVPAAMSGQQAPTLQ
jgi:hypothetical protein